MPLPPELLVPGPRWARVATDVVAVAGVVSFVAAFWWDGIVVGMFALVLLGLTVPRVLQLPGQLQVATGVTLLLSGWAATLDWYVIVPWLDMVAHLVANGLLAIIAMVLMWRTGVLPRELPRAGVVVVTAAVGALLAVLWEAGEWFGYTYLSDDIGVGYDDTIGDLVAGTVGSLIGGGLVAGGPLQEDERRG